MAWPLLKILALLTMISVECLGLQSDTITVFSLNHIGSGHELRSGLAAGALPSEPSQWYSSALYVASQTWGKAACHKLYILIY